MCTRDDCAGGLHGTCKNEKTCRDAEAAAREGGDEAAGEECVMGIGMEFVADKAIVKFKEVLWYLANISNVTINQY